MFKIEGGISKVNCNVEGCKETLKVEKAGTRPRVTRQAVRAAEWLWLGTKVQLCPKHKNKAAEFKAEKGSSKKEKKAAVKKTVKVNKVKGNGSKPTFIKPANRVIGSEPMTVGQSIGKLARTAKVAARPAAE